MNGEFLRAHGHGIQELDVRELCSLAYAMITEDMTRHYYALVAAGAKFNDSEDPLGDQIYRFEEKIGIRFNPEDIALAAHKAWLKRRGMEWDDTPVGAGNGQWWDTNVEWTRQTTMGDLDTEAEKARGKKPAPVPPARVPAARPPDEFKGAGVFVRDLPPRKG